MKTSPDAILIMVKYLQIILFTAVILYVGKTLFIPLFFGLLIAMVMHPVCKWFEKYGWGQALSIAACLLIVTLLFAGLFALMIWQLNMFGKEAPALIHKLDTALHSLQLWLTESLGVTSAIQHNWIEKITGSVGTVLQSTVQTTLQLLFMLFLIPVYAALIMYHRKVFVQYLKLVVPAKYRFQLDGILQQIIATYFNYIKGMLIVYLLVGLLNSLGLFAFGVQHAILFGMLCAIMTIIPYVGIFISALLPISVIWMDTGNVWYPVGLVVMFSFVQYLEANVIFPKVVGTQLNVSTLAMLLAIIAGGIIWGVAGMVLFIPMVAILKIISDHIEEWKPLNLLLSRN